MSSDVDVELARLRQLVQTLSEHVTQHSDALGALEDAMTAAATTDVEAGHGSDTTELQVSSAAAPPDLAVLRPWVEANVSAWCERRMQTKPNGQGVRWCARWDCHPEAVTRLWALREQQLAAASAGTIEISAYLRDHFDHHIAILTSTDGPFHNCTPTEHAPGKEGRRYLPTEPVLRAVG